jgi:hypothetical protein
MLWHMTSVTYPAIFAAVVGLAMMAAGKNPGKVLMCGSISFGAGLLALLMRFAA